MTEIKEGYLPFGQYRTYYRIVDTARKYNKPIRYFTYASAVKCAKQVVDNDR